MLIELDGCLIRYKNQRSQMYTKKNPIIVQSISITYTNIYIYIYTYIYICVCVCVCVCVNTHTQIRKCWTDIFFSSSMVLHLFLQGYSFLRENNLEAISCVHIFLHSTSYVFYITICRNWDITLLTLWLHNFYSCRIFSYFELTYKWLRI